MVRLVIAALLAACGRLGFDARIDTDGAVDLLELVPAEATINLGSKQSFVVSGGAPPYTLAIVGEGALDAGVFVAPSHAGETIVRATDADGNTGSAVVRYRGERLFVVGGLEGAAVASVLSSSDGASWVETGSLPVPRANGALVVYDDRMFYLGGLNQGGVPSQEIFVSSDGASWSMHGMLPTTNTGFASVVHAGEMWIVGGSTDNGNSVQAFHSSDGATWVSAAPITTPRHEHDLIVHGSRLTVIGGHGDVAFLDDVQSTVDGIAWEPADATLTFTCDFAAAGRLGDRVIRTCGDGCTNTETSLDLASWTPAADLPSPREGPALVGFEDQLLLIGGDTDVLATVDGSSWAIVGALPQPRTRTAATAFTPP